MSKIEEIIQQTIESNGHWNGEFFDKNEMRLAMIEYAEYYLRLGLSIAAENATLHIDEGTGISRPPSVEYKEYGITHHVKVSNTSITNIQLPPHD